MLNRTSLRDIYAVFMLLLLIPVFSSTSVEAKSYRICKPGLLGGKFHFHHGSGQIQRSKNLAMKSAAKDWSGFTAWEYGRSWANIRSARQVRYNCKKLSSRSWQCDVDAVPCILTRR